MVSKSGIRDFEKELARHIRVEIWEAGISLGMSYRKFGAPHQIQQQLDKAGTPGSPMMIELMLGDVCGQISEGRLIALGFRVKPRPSNGPVIVPSDVFTVRPDFESAFHGDEVKASGYKYERVTVLKTDRFLSLIDELQKGDPTSPKRHDKNKASDGAKNAKRSGGRTSLYPQAKAVFEKLFTDKPFLKLRPAAKIAEEFNELYKAMHSPDGNDFSSLDPRTIRTHLKTYRKELESIGKN